MTRAGSSELNGTRPTNVPATGSQLPSPPLPPCSERLTRERSVCTPDDELIDLLGGESIEELHRRSDRGGSEVDEHRVVESRELMDDAALFAVFGPRLPPPRLP